MGRKDINGCRPEPVHHRKHKTNRWLPLALLTLGIAGVGVAYYYYHNNSTTNNNSNNCNNGTTTTNVITVKKKRRCGHREDEDCDCEDEYFDDMGDMQCDKEYIEEGCDDEWSDRPYEDCSSSMSTSNCDPRRRRRRRRHYRELQTNPLALPSLTSTTTGNVATLNNALNNSNNQTIVQQQVQSKSNVLQHKSVGLNRFKRPT